MKFLVNNSQQQNLMEEALSPNPQIEFTFSWNYKMGVKNYIVQINPP